jgi:hypothetical protein
MDRGKKVLAAKCEYISPFFCCRRFSCFKQSGRNDPTFFFLSRFPPFFSGIDENEIDRLGWKVGTRGLAAADLVTVKKARALRCAD